MDGVASGYWTPSAKRSSGYQPFRFDSLALRGHSMFANILDNAAARVILKMFRGRVQYPKLRPRLMTGAVHFVAQLCLGRAAFLAPLYSAKSPKGPCHPEAAESPAKRATPDEGSL